MPDKIKIVAICGSTRKASSNLHLINAIANLSAELFDIIVFEGLSALPHFNPDLDNENPPKEITDFRNLLKSAEGILICTPEYALGVPGTLKNAIDWTVSSMEFTNKPVALITASSAGEKAHKSLLGTLLIIESKITRDTQVHIPFVKTKITGDQITDTDTLIKINKLIVSLTEIIKNVPEAKLSAPVLIKEGIDYDKK